MENKALRFWVGGNKTELYPYPLLSGADRYIGFGEYFHDTAYDGYPGAVAVTFDLAARTLHLWHWGTSGGVYQTWIKLQEIDMNELVTLKKLGGES